MDNDDTVHLWEDAGSSSGVDVRDLHGNFYTILIDDPNSQSVYNDFLGKQLVSHFLLTTCTCT